MTIFLPPQLPTIPHGSTNEKLIVGKLVTDLIAAGFALSVYDGEETTVTDSTDPAVIFEALASTDQDQLYVGKDGMTPGRFIVLIWGNDTDIISDYSTSLEAEIKGACDLAEQLARGW